MKTQVEIEAALCEHLARFAYDYLGQEPKTTRVYLLNDLLVVRLSVNLSRGRVPSSCMSRNISQERQPKTRSSVPLQGFDGQFDVSW